MCVSEAPRRGLRLCPTVTLDGGVDLCFGAHLGENFAVSQPGRGGSSQAWVKKEGRRGPGIVTPHCQCLQSQNWAHPGGGGELIDSCVVGWWGACCSQILGDEVDVPLGILEGPLPAGFGWPQTGSVWSLCA